MHGLRVRALPGAADEERGERFVQPPADGGRIQVHGQPPVGIIHAAREEINYLEGNWPPDGVRV
jgi:hypothetical protein